MARITCLLVLIAGAAVLGAPAPQHAGVAVFDTAVSEGDAKYVQHVELDFDKRTERFSVPAHNTLDAADKMNDLANGYSVTCYRERVPALCVLADLSRVPHADIEELNTGFIINQYTEGGKIDSREEEEVRTRWVMTDGPLTLLTFLSPEMQRFVADLPVFRVEPLPDSAPVLDIPLQDAPETVGADRVRRQAFPVFTMPTCTDSHGKKTAPVDTFGMLRSDCAHIFTCDPAIRNPNDPRGCRKTAHLRAAIFVSCKCCPGVTNSNKCTCLDTNGRLIRNG